MQRTKQILTRAALALTVAGLAFGSSACQLIGNTGAA